MNSLVEILNHCGEDALQFAWPMLWQSSALIVALFVLDFVLRKKIRAAIRYTLWLVVLVKLILSPTIASPTSLRWWIHFSNQPTAKVKITPVTVTYGGYVAPPNFQMPSAPVPVAPRPHLSSSAIIFIASGVGSFGLFTWLLIRWRNVMRKIREAKISNDFNLLLDEVRQLTGLRSEIRLKLTEDSMSPAVCGLFRPVILLPQSLAKNLSREQLRAVLLHEMIHLRRGDVWLNCVQALLQIVYWWHPLLWLANARIRRVREEAVDDAVMLALRDNAEIYAPTLLEVAKFAFRRPLASLGLVGILESRSALRQRIERLMEFSAPRKAGLTIISVLGILAFSAVALPMGEAPEKTNVETVSLQNNFSTITTNDIEKKVEAGKLVQDGKLFYEIGKFEEAEIKLRAALETDADNQAALYYLTLVKKARYAAKPRSSTVIPNRLDNPAHSNLLIADAAAENGDFSTMTFKINRPTNEDDLKKLLSDAGVKNPTKFFFYAREILIVRGSVEQLALAQGVVLKLNGFSPKEIDEANNRFLKQPQLPANPEWDNQLAMRTFKVNAVVFADTLRNNSDLQTTNLSTMAKDFFEKLGVDLEATGKSITFNDKLELLFVKATASDLDTIERAIDALNQVTPQVHIKARFIEVPKGFVLPQTFSNVSMNPMIGILSDTNFRAVLHNLEQQEKAETLAELEVVTTSGRQTQMRATDLQNILTNFAFEETSSNSYIVPQFGKFEIGSTIDLVPYVLSDDYTIFLTAIPRLIQFLGYDQPTNIVFATNKIGEKIQIPSISPSFHVQKLEANVNLWDDQTVVLGGLISISNENTKDKVPLLGDLPVLGRLFRSQSKIEEKKSLMVFITATIVDAAGNRVHSENELQSKLPAIPPQPQQ